MKDESANQVVMPTVAGSKRKAVSFSLFVFSAQVRLLRD